MPLEDAGTEWTGVVNEVKQQVKSLKKAQSDEIEYVQTKMLSIEVKLEAQGDKMRAIATKLDAVLSALSRPEPEPESA